MRQLDRGETLSGGPSADPRPRRGSGRGAAAGAAYVAASVPAHLAWEMLQPPLYTIWRTGTASEIAFALAHCTVGDTLIAAASLGAAVALVGRGWPAAGYWRVAAAAIALGVGYTIFSEYWNVSVRGSWSYAGWMPTVPWVGTGLAPLLQWLVIPAVVFRYRRPRQIAFPVRA